MTSHRNGFMKLLFPQENVLRAFSKNTVELSLSVCCFAASLHSSSVQLCYTVVPYPHHFPHYTGAVWGVSRDVPSDSGSPAINIRIDTQWYSGYYPYITGCVGSGLPPSDAAGYRPASEARNKRRVFCLRYNQHTSLLCNNQFFTTLI